MQLFNVYVYAKYVEDSSYNFTTTTIIGMGLSTCSLDACSVLGVFDGAWAQVLESEHMLVLKGKKFAFTI